MKNSIQNNSNLRSSLKNQLLLDKYNILKRRLSLFSLLIGLFFGSLEVCIASSIHEKNMDSPKEIIIDESQIKVDQDIFHMSLSDWEILMKRNVYWNTYSQKDKKILIDKVKEFKDVLPFIEKSVKDYIKNKYLPHSPVKIVGIYLNGSSIYKRSLKDKASDLDFVVIVEGQDIYDVALDLPNSLKNNKFNISGFAIISTKSNKNGHPHIFTALHSAVRGGIPLVGQKVIQGDISFYQNLVDIKELSDSGLKYLFMGPKYYRKWNNRYIEIQSILYQLGMCPKFDHLKYWERNDELEEAILKNDHQVLENFFRKFIHEYEEIQEIILKKLEEDEKTLILKSFSLEKLKVTDDSAHFSSSSSFSSSLCKSRQEWLGYLNKAHDPHLSEEDYKKIEELDDSSLVVTVAQYSQEPKILAKIYNNLEPQNSLYIAILFQLTRNIFTPKFILEEIFKNRMLISKNSEFLIRALASNLNTPSSILKKINKLSNEFQKIIAETTKKKDILENKMKLNIPNDYHKYKDGKDFHIHTIYSDGYLSPEEILIGSNFLGLKEISISDHNNMKGAQFAEKLGKKYNIRIKRNVEIDSNVIIEGHNIPIHVLAYDVDLYNSALQEAFKNFHLKNNARSEKIINLINTILKPSYKITTEELLKISPSGQFSLKDMICALRKKGASESVILKVKNTYIKTALKGNPEYLEKITVAPLSEVIKLIHEAKGEAILAHPGVIVDSLRRSLNTLPSKKITSLQEAWEIFNTHFNVLFIQPGIDGVEVDHPSHSKFDSDQLEVLMKKFNLKRGSGSDYHADQNQKRSLGESDTTIREEIENLVYSFSTEKDLHKAYFSWHKLMEYKEKAIESFTKLLESEDLFTQSLAIIGLKKTGLNEKSIQILKKILYYPGKKEGLDKGEMIRSLAAITLGGTSEKFLRKEKVIDVLIDKLSERRGNDYQKNIAGSPVAYYSREKLGKIARHNIDFQNEISYKAIINIKKAINSNTCVEIGNESDEVLRARHLILLLGGLHHSHLEIKKFMSDILELYSNEAFTNQDKIIWTNTIQVLSNFNSKDITKLLLKTYYHKNASTTVKVRVIEALGDMEALKEFEEIASAFEKNNTFKEKNFTIIYSAIRRTKELIDIRKKVNKKDSNSTIFHMSFHGLYDGKLSALGGRDGGGQITYVIEMAKSLENVKSENQIYVIARNVVYDESLKEDFPDIDYSNFREYLGQKTSLIRLPFGSDTFLPRSELWQNNISALNSYKRFLKMTNVNPSIVHIHSADGVTIHFGKEIVKEKIPLVFSIHSPGIIKLIELTRDSDNPRKKFDTLENPMELISRILGEEILLHISDKVIASTHHEKNHQLSLYWALQNKLDKKVIVISPGIDSKIFNQTLPSNLEIRNKLINLIKKQFSKESQGKPCILLLSRFVKRKNILGLVKIWANDPDLREKSNLIIVGGDIRVINGANIEDIQGEEKQVYQAIQREISKHNLQGKVAFMGSLEHSKEVPEIYRLVSQGVDSLFEGNGIFVNPALFELFGLTTLEAMSTGLVPVVTDNGGAVEIIEQGKNGFLVNVKNKKEFTNILKELINDLPKRKKISKYAQEYVSQHYSWKNSAEKLMKTYNELCDESYLQKLATNLIRQESFYDW